NWKNGQLKLISATTAFGMGCASRDGVAAKNVIMYSSSDICTLLLIISQGRPSNEEVCSETNSLVDKADSIFEIVAYCESVNECYQQQVYQSFLWPGDLSIVECNNCDNCDR
ncbi:7770_t:CDS:2, partial [Cetraspora pellucida]